MKLKTSQENIEKLWELYHGVRPTTPDVKVPKELLFNLLTDHGSLWAANQKGNSNAKSTD